jgi:hypothetical protein
VKHTRVHLNGVDKAATPGLRAEELGKLVGRRDGNSVMRTDIRRYPTDMGTRIIFICGWHPYPIQIETGIEHVFFLTRG